MTKKISIGISSCLIGNNVRFNGGNCHKSYITGEYSNYFDYKVVCPEVEAGLGVPREAMFLVRDITTNVFLVKTSKSNKDVTDDITNAAKNILSNLDQVYGFILKTKSPICGVMTARVFNHEHKYTMVKDDGIFVKALREYDPLLPLEDEGKLTNKVLRDHFLRKVFCYYDLKTRLLACKNISELMEYHSTHKILLRLHNNLIKKELGRMLSSHDSCDIDKLKRSYTEIFMRAIQAPVSRNRHYMALQNVLREINKNISKSQRSYLQQILVQYKDSKLSWDVPVGIIKMHLLDIDLPYLDKQSYLNPYNEGLILSSIEN